MRSFRRIPTTSSQEDVGCVKVLGIPNDTVAMVDVVVALSAKCRISENISSSMNARATSVRTRRLFKVLVKMNHRTAEVE